MKAIQIANALGTPLYIQEYPRSKGLHGSGPEYERLKREYAIKAEETKRLGGVNELVHQRSAAKGQLAFLYIGIPDGELQLKKVLQQHLGDDAAAERT